MDPSKLAERLRDIVGHHRPPAAPAPFDAATVPRVPADRAQQADARAAAVAAALGGAWQPADGGRCLVVERRIDRTAAYGRSAVSGFHAAIDEALASASILAGGADASAPLVFFDLETTGLSGGAGTYAFLIGCAWFDEDGGFVTRQYVLTRLADERIVLRAFAGELARAGALVSYNGRAFDAPLLETRYLYHRLAWPGAGLPHLDVLHPARRFWGAPSPDHGRSTQSPPSSPSQALSALNVTSTSSCALGALERRVLGAARTGDVPGFEIPGRYFQFVRSGDARPLAGVLEHNRLDLLSLAGVTARLLTLVHRGCETVEHGAEALALGRVYAHAGLDERADAAYRHAATLARGESVWIEVEALRALARRARRRRDFEEAAEWWRQLLRVDRCPREAACEAHQALAIHHEHRLRDLESARSFALRVLEDRPAWADAVRHRLARIERKMGLF